MSRFEDCVNELGYGVVQLAAFAGKASELGEAARTTCEKVSAFMQEQITEGNTLKQSNQALLQENADLKRQLEKSILLIFAFDFWRLIYFFLPLIATKITPR